jgi:hypothetical protein
MRLAFVTSSDSMPRDSMPRDSMSGGVSGSRRRARAEAARSESVWVRLSPDEAAAVGEAAARVGMSVGAWVGETAVGGARVDAAGDEPGEAGGVGLPSWRELVAALVALRAEVAALRRLPVAELSSALPAAELFHGQLARGVAGGADRDDVAEVLRRIDAVTGVVLEAASSATRSSPGRGRERPEQP